ncbi:hypothetical protein KSI23_21330, partial [Salmonella enterica subsp. enterica serovar Indiana]|nr:hypothetical protein [Salmonella enterica subsp. enterica serovar Indiana]MCC1785214.1 hypothetical protein [Salmonella enterica subsp. enterica serovar Indiana]MCC1799053.1 hypothetical protein [Salmonella enterica subsp. enterica serovar Indiana]MCC1803949.1 hypothetical protein [Salmonella enterica subsp. enterica serovar Indiana]MCC1808744.1 hypothetical protein [Salmonella enterica subsp. enterica serovar Indiana]
RLRFSGPKTSIICSPMTSLKTSIKTITYLSDIGCLEIQGASLTVFLKKALLIKNFPPYWQATNSFPSCITRRMKLSVMSVLCLHPEAASTREKIHWQLLQQKLQS